MGTAKEELIGKRLYDFFTPNVVERRRQKWNEVFDTGKPVSFQDSRNGMIFDQRAYPILDDGGQVEMVAVFAKDITSRKQAEEELRESEERYRTLVDNLPVAVYRNTPGPEGKFLMANPAFCKMFGFKSEEEVKKFTPADVYPDPKKRKQYSDNLVEKGLIKNYEQTLVKRDGTPIYTSITASVVYGKDGKVSHFDSIMLDITDQKRLEAQLLQAQKMEAIGTLAGGVAHDLNNILGGLVSYPELLLMQIPHDSPFRKSILTIQKSGEKAAAVVQDLLTLARRGVVVTEVVNPNDVIAEYLKSPECENLQSYHPGVHIETHLEKDSLNILGSSVHLSKTIMNLVSNAAEAMPEGGKLTISTENRYIDRPIRGYEDVVEGDYVVLTISDTGTGISPDDIEKIFEPFYTKKKMGRSGTGLGMAVVWGTVKDHKGYIDVQSTEGEARPPRLRARDGGQGTIFTLYFPVTRKELPEDKSHLAIGSYSGNGESILIVDDVEEQRNIASGMLK
ncbi:MAG: PAS domain S-box protein, partial [Desulfobulbaceae bacterium]|nr:PAS domain S-box protein [Desulfobulbaceae bacterium]